MKKKILILIIIFIISYSVSVLSNQLNDVLEIEVIESSDDILKYISESDYDTQAETVYDILSFGMTLNVMGNSLSQITNPYPSNASTGVELIPTLQIDVNDSDNDTMDITWYTNLSGGWNNTFGVHQAEITLESITTRMSHERQSVYANGSYWIFYCEGNNGDKAYTSSTDGINWNAGTTFRNSQIGGADFSIAMVNDTIFDYVYTYGFDGIGVRYRRGEFQSGGTINWLTAEQEIDATERCYDPNICINESGYPWITYISSLSYYPYVTTSSTNTGTWNTRAGFPYELKHDGYNLPIPVPLSNGSTYVMWGNSGFYGEIYGNLWNETGWCGEEQATTYNVSNEFYGKFSAVAIDNDVHIVFLNESDNKIYHLIRDNVTGWQTPVEIYDACTDEVSPSLSKTDDGELFCFWMMDPVYDTAYYSYWDGNTWSSHIAWFFDEKMGANDDYEYQMQHCWYEEINNKIGFVYRPYVVYGNSWGVNFTYLEHIGDGWLFFGWNNSVNNGTYSQVNNNFSNELSTYYWYVSVDDGKNVNSSDYYHFTTLDINYPPTQNGISPDNGSVDVSLLPTLSVLCADPDNDELNATWWSNSSGSWVQFASNETSFPSDTTIIQINLNFSDSNTTYWWSVNLTDGHNEWCNETYHFTTQSVLTVYSTLSFGMTLEVESQNKSVFFCNPNPSNGSTGISIGTVSWNITINDPEGDLFGWSIETFPAVGNNNGAGDTNGSKSTNIAGLQYDTNYTVYVNASDTGSGIDVNETFWFITEQSINTTIYATLSFGMTLEVEGDGNQSVTFSNPDPTNNSINVPVTRTNISILINDSEGDSFNWTIELSNGNNSNGTYEINGTKICYVNLSEGITYTWWVNATDNGSMVPTNASYVFTTQGALNTTVYDILSFGMTLEVEGTNPIQSNPSPSNGSTDAEMYPLLSIDVTDPTGLNMDVNFSTNATSWYQLNVSIVDGTYMARAVWANQSNTTYWWNVSVNNSNNEWANATYHFTTDQYHWSNPSDWWEFTYTSCSEPSSFNAYSLNETIINLTWTKGAGSHKTVICRNSTGVPNYPADPNDGILVINGSGTTCNDTDLKPMTTYYYAAWGWNQTISEFSVDNITTYNTTGGGIEFINLQLSHNRRHSTTIGNSPVDWINITVTCIYADDVYLNITDAMSTSINHTITTNHSDNLWYWNSTFGPYSGNGSYSFFFYGNTTLLNNISSTYGFVIYPMCDINMDNFTDVGDISHVTGAGNWSSNGVNRFSEDDVNADGWVDIGDISYIIDTTRWGAVPKP